MSEEIDLNNKTPQELVEIFFNTANIKKVYKYSNELRLKILDVIPELIREHSNKLINFIDLAFAPVVKKIIEKKLVDWSKIPEWNGWKMDLKLILLRAEYLDLIGDEDKNIIRELAEKNPNAFYELSAANKKALDDKLGTNLKYDEKSESELAKVFCKKYLSDLQSKMWSQTGDVSGGYCWAKATYQALHKIYDYNYWSKSDNYENILMPYVKDIKKEYPSAWKDNESSGSSGKHPYACLYESKRTDTPIVSFELIDNKKGIGMPAALFRNGKICYYSTASKLLGDQEYDNLDFRDLISAVLDKCPVVVGKGNHAQYLKEDMSGRKKFLRCMVEFLFSNQFLLFSEGDAISFSCAYVTQSVHSRFATFFCELFNYVSDDDMDDIRIENKIDEALKNIKDPVFRCYEKIKFGKFFCEEFIRQYIEERDKNGNLDMEPCVFLNAVLKDFVENHVDKSLFEKDQTEEKPIDPLKNDNEQQNQENQDKPLENPISSTKPENSSNTEEKETSDQKSDSHQETNDQKHEPDYKAHENLDKPLENSIGVSKALEIDFDQEINKLLTSERKSWEIKSLKTVLDSNGKFADFIRIFNDRVIEEIKSIKAVFENYFNNPNPDLKRIKTQLRNYIELCYPEGEVKNKFVQQINDLDKVSTWQKFLEIIMGILTFLFTFDKNKITKPKELLIFSRLKDTEKTLLKQSNNQKCNKSLRR